MSRQSVIVKDVLNFLLTKLEGGYFDENIMDIAYDKMTGAESSNIEFVEEFLGDIHEELSERLRRA